MKLIKIKEIEKMVDTGKLFYKGKNDKCNFRQFDTVRSFARSAFTGKINLDEADEDKVELLIQIMDFNKKRKLKKPKKKNLKKDILASV